MPIGWFSTVYAPPFVFRKHHGHLGHVVFLPLEALPSDVVSGWAQVYSNSSRFRRSKLANHMFDQIAAAFDVCRDAVAAALEEQHRTNLEFQDEVRGLLKKKDDEIAELKEQLTLSLQEVKVLREQMKIEADLTAVDIRGFRTEIDRLKQLLAKKLLEQERVLQKPEESAESEEAHMIKIQNLARALALL